MNKKVLYIGITLLIFLGSTISLIFSKERGDKMINVSAKYVSIINLIATPERFHNTLVIVIGFASVEFEGNAIYLSKESYTMYTDGIWLDIDPNKYNEYKKYNKKYVLVEGVFDKNNHGHRGAYLGSIKQIRRIKELQLRSAP